MHVPEVIKVSLRHELKQAKALCLVIVTAMVLARQHCSQDDGVQDETADRNRHHDVSPFYATEDRKEMGRASISMLVRESADMSFFVL